ncbi:hypothetical protein [Solemya velesiana gill symbiont]|uniref:Uncharacterized protein n=1 Tax=Solemya velesiana gill symbiont TaxID=1918948 RepID=A0A1T2KXA8_9GAMM|nr:hypothetical protein [Solemya velesiana gill symbiont]OOZ37444.1 hypothetical protein BOW51_02565 [Solemya velesiana gill symbiont]
MSDYITYCADTQALITELQSKAPKLVHNDEQTGEIAFLMPKTPTLRNGAETLALVRDIDGTLLQLAAQLDHLEVLGTYEEVFADPAKKKIYDRVYDQSPRTVHGLKGETLTYTPPQGFPYSVQSRDSLSQQQERLA